jgi:Domain of unknown function (DUF4129)
VRSLLLPVVLAAMVLLGPASARAEPHEAQEVHERAARILGKDKGYQTELPGQGQPAGANDASGGKSSRLRKHVDELAPLAAGSAVASVVMYVVAGVAILLLILFLVRELGGYEKNVEGGDGKLAAETPEATAAVVERPLDDAEVLARAGRFGEAIHALLLRTLEELMRRLDRPLPRSKTSREILAEVRLPDEARGALSHLVSAVEVSFFGGAEPGAEDYQVCVERFRRFADAYTRGLRA